MNSKDIYQVALLALVIWREARGEGLEGMRAVAHVIANRAKAWHQDWDAVITNRNQFSSMTVSGDSQTTVWPDDDNPLFEQVLNIAQAVHAGTDPDNTGGALYYENPAIATSEWFIKNIRENTAQHPVTIHINHHVFYR